LRYTAASIENKSVTAKPRRPKINIFTHYPFSNCLFTNRGAEARRINTRYKNRQEIIFGVHNTRKAFLSLVSFSFMNKSVRDVFMVLEVQNTRIFFLECIPKISVVHSSLRKKHSTMDNAKPVTGAEGSLHAVIECFVINKRLTYA
jgi:hypothetical protein